MQFKYLKHDLYRYFYPDDSVSNISIFSKFRIVLFTQAVWAIIIYRFLRWTIYECKVPILDKLLFIIGSILELIIQVTTGINIEAGSDIGPGLYIGHFGNIFIPGDVKIGKFCNLSHENTLGIAGRGINRGVPTIGDFVYIGAGAKIIGKISIGNNVAIGANAVVTKDMADNSVAVGVPAKVISYDSSSDFIEFNRNKNLDFLDDD